MEKKNAWKIKYLERYKIYATKVEIAKIKEEELERMRCPALEVQYQAAVKKRKQLETDLEKVYEETKSIIETLEEEKEEKVLTLIYIGRQNWKEIAKAMSYSERQIKRIHGSAVDNIKMSRNVMECHGMS